MPEQAERVVAIGDLNGAFDLLRSMLRALSIIDREDHWIGGATHLIQIGDIFNRSGGARATFLFLDVLKREAAAQGGQVTVLLGNHEVMTALRNEAYCTVEEYLSFASEKQRSGWKKRVERAQRQLYRDHPPGGPILPLGPRLEEWKIHNVPGRSALRRELGPSGRIGRMLRELPVAIVASGCVFCHAALTPVWARLGVEGLNRAAAREWESAPAFYEELSSKSLFRATQGPLWNRRLTMRVNIRTTNQLARSLRRLNARRMVVGHTVTAHIPGGEAGRIAVRHDGRLICIDVGLGRNHPSPQAVLIVEGPRGMEWTPEGTHQLWCDAPQADEDMDTDMDMKALPVEQPSP